MIEKFSISLERMPWERGQFVRARVVYAGIVVEERAELPDSPTTNEVEMCFEYLKYQLMRAVRTSEGKTAFAQGLEIAAQEGRHFSQDAVGPLSDWLEENGHHELAMKARWVR